MEKNNQKKQPPPKQTGFLRFSMKKKKKIHPLNLNIYILKKLENRKCTVIDMASTS